MAQFVKQYVQDLTEDIHIRQGGTIVFNDDNLSNVISVDVLNNGEPATISGTVVGAVICSDGSTVPVDNGSIGGENNNTVSITLTAACFEIPGRIGVGIQLVSGTTKTTILKAIYNVELLTTDNVIDPSSRITLEVSDLIDDIEDAIASIPADYTDLLDAIAPTFSSDNTYTIGQYVWHNQSLYRFKADHSGNWSSSDVALISVMTEVPKAVSYAYTQNLNVAQGTRARTNIAAAALPALDLGNNDIAEVPSGTDLNDLRTPGTYKVNTAAIAASISHGPVTTENYRLIVSYAVNTNSILQIAITRAQCRIYTRTGTTPGSGTTTWTDWVLLTTKDELDALKAVSYAIQTLTDAEKTQARTNIGAVSSADLAALKAVSYDAQTLTDAEKTQARTNISGASNADIAQINANTAPEFSASNNYIAGQYVMHNGELWRFDEYHAAGAWAGTDDATQIAIADEVSTLLPTQILNGIKWTFGQYVKNDGTIVTQDAQNFKTSDLIPCHGQDSVTFIGDTANATTNAIAFYGANHKYISGGSNIGTRGEPQTVTVPSNAYFLRVTARKNQPSAYIDFNGTTPLRPLADEAYMTRIEFDAHLSQFDQFSPFTYKGGRTITENTDSYFDGIPGNFVPFTYPSAFTGTYRPVNIFTDGKHYATDFKADNFKVTGGRTIYAAKNGSATNDGGRTTPLTLYRAITGAQDGDTVICLSGVYTAGDLSLLINDEDIFKKHINIIGEGDVRFLIGGVVFSGEYDSVTGLWKQTRSSVNQVVDVGLKHRWAKQTSLENCQALQGSWYTDGSTVYINATYSPDVYLLQSSTPLNNGFKIFNSDSGRIYWENITIIGGGYNIYLKQATNTTFEAVFNKCNFLFSYGGPGGSDATNAVWANSGNLLFHQCRAAYAYADGFGYKSSGAQFVEIECIGHDCGLFGSGGDNTRNGSTSHAGARGIRINGLYYENMGANVADVQSSTMTINLGCVAKDSQASVDANNAGFSAQQEGATMWLYNCEASGNTYDLHAVTGTNLYADGCVYNASIGPVTSTGGNHIPTTGNLNEYKTPGTYVYGKDDLSGLTGVPVGVTERFTLQVISNGSTHPYQMLITDGGMLFVRRSAATTSGWRTWYKFEGTSVGVIENNGNG